MYKKLEEFSNKYLTIYADAHRIVFDFKYPRLFQRHQSGAFALGSLVDSGAMGNGLTNFMPYDQLNPRSTTVSVSATTASQLTISNSSVTGVNGTYWYNNQEEDVIDVKRLVISSKTKFGRVYLIDSGDRVVRLNKSKTKALENPYHVQEMLRFFGQFNPHVTKLAAAAILPKERINPEEIAKFENVMFTLNAALGENSAQGYIWSFMFPVLAECRYYDWAYSDRGIISNLITRSSSINNLTFYKNLKKCTSLLEFYRLSFGVKGSAFMKKIMALSKGVKESRAGLSALWHQRHSAAGTANAVPDADLVVVPEEVINRDLAAGRDLKTFEYNADGTHMQIFTEVLFGSSPSHRQVGYNYSYYHPFKTAFKSEEFYHLGPLRMLEIYNGIIPIDYWFELEEIPDVMYQMQEDQRKKLREWLTDKPDHIKKKIFLTLKDINGFLDTIRQLSEYQSASDIPEDLREIYPNGLKIPSRWATANELHDMVSAQYNQIKHFAKNRAIKYLPGLDVLDKIDFGNGFTSEIPRKTARIVEYGALLKHCVAGYADRCADNNDTVILSINKDGRPHYTLELRCATRNVFGRYNTTTPDELIYDKIEQEDGTMKMVMKLKYTIQQFKGLQNKVPTAEEVSDILQGLKATGVIGEVHEPHRGDGVYIQGVRQENGDIALNNGVTIRIPNPRHHVVIRNLDGSDVTITPNGPQELNVQGPANIEFIQNAVYNDDGQALVAGIGEMQWANLQNYVGAVNGEPSEVPPEPPIEPMPQEALQHLMNALQDPQQHDNIHIRDQDGVLANAAANNGE